MHGKLHTLVPSNRRHFGNLLPVVTCLSVSPKGNWVFKLCFLMAVFSVYSGGGWASLHVFNDRNETVHPPYCCIAVLESVNKSSRLSEFKCVLSD